MTERIGLQAVFETDAFSNGLAVYLRGNIQAEASTNRVASAINSAGIGIAAGFGSAMGTVAVNAIGQFIDSARNAVSEALDLASAFEQLEFGIRALGAQQDLLAGSTKDFGTLFDENKEKAQGYLILLQDLAIPSIFTTQQIAQGQQMLQTFGFAQDAAFEWNRLLVNMATAGNLPVETMGRLAYAIGQVSSEGRLLATEARQFSNARVNIIGILAEELGKTTAQIREDMKDGLLTADVVFPALVKYLKNFDGVTEESAKTLRGMFSALQDVKEISVSNFMRGLLEPVIPILQKITSFFTSEGFRAGATALGEVLGPRLAQAVQMGLDSLQRLFTAITSISPEALQMIAVFAGSFVVLTGFAALLGVVALAISALVTPFTLVVAALSAFITYYVSVAQRVTDSTNAMSVIVGDLSNVFGQGFGNAVNTAISVLSDLQTFMANFIGNVAEWGANVVETFALGINSAISLVVDAMNTLASVMSYFLAPGSPPRILPDLDKWGKEAADVYLKGWTDADFSALDELGNLIESALKLNFGESDRGIPTFKWIAQAKQAVAQAIDEIRNFGQISQNTFASIAKAVGSSSDEVFGYLNRLTVLTNATKVAEEAQKRLNDVTEAYDKLIAPLQQKLDAASEAKQRAGEETEIKGLQRLLSTAGVSDTRKAEASARIQEILARQQLATLQLQKEEAVDKAQVELDAATKAQEAAQKELDLFNQRLQAQNTYNSAIESGMQALERAAEKAAKAAKEGLTPLEKQLKIIQLQQEEMADLIKEAKARKVLEDENATAAQKMTAQLELQEIAVRRQLRDIEAAKLGTTLDAIREIAIVAADLEKPKKGDNKLDAIASSFDILSNVDPEGRLSKFREAVDNFKISYEGMLTSITEGATKINNALPPFLRFMNPPGQENAEVPPFWKNFGTIIGSLAAFKFGTVTAGLLGLGPAGVIAAGGVSLFAAAYIGDWFGMRDKVELAINFIQEKLKELGESQTYQVIKEKLLDLKKVIDDFLSGESTPSEDLMGGNPPKKTGSKASRLLQDIVDGFTNPDNIAKARAQIAGALVSLFDIDLNDIFTNAFKTGKGITDISQPLISAWIRGTGDAIAAFMEWFLSKGLPGLIKGIFGLFAGSFKRESPTEVIQAVKDFFVNLWVEGGEIWKAVIDAGTAIGSAFIRGMTAFVTEIGIMNAIGAFMTWIKGITDYWGITEGESVKAGDELGVPIAHGIISGIVRTLIDRNPITRVVNALISLGAGFVTDPTRVTKWAENAATIATEFLIALVKVFVVDGPLRLAEALLGMLIGSITPDLLANYRVEGQSLGESMILGIVEGLSTVVPGGDTDLGKAIKQKIQDALSNTIDFIESHSPSGLFRREVGVPIATGIEEGAGALNLQSIIESAVTKAIDALSGKIVSTLSTTTTQIAGLYQTLRTDLGAILVGMFADQTAWQSSMTGTITEWTLLIYGLYVSFYSQLSIDTGLFVSAIQTHYGVLQSGVENTVRTTSTNVQTFFDDLHTAIAKKLDETIETIKTKLADMLDVIRVDFVEWGDDLGEDFAEGIAEGILSKVEDITDAAVSVVKQAVAAAETELETGSPSKKSEEKIGQPFGMGIAAGILKSIDPIMNSVNTLMDSMIGSQPSRTNNGTTTNVTNVRHYHLNVQAQQPSKGVVYDFGIMELMNA